MTILERLKQVMPAHIKPVFASVDEWQKFHERESARSAQKILEENRLNVVKKIMGRSGINPLHQACTFDNYLVESDDQRKAIDSARNFVQDFLAGKQGGFVFMGGVGTGKNHLAAAIANVLIGEHKTVLILTMTEIEMKLKSTYEKESMFSETEFARKLIEVDLLVIDEVGVQHKNSENTKIFINHIVDQRTSNFKSVGILTNEDQSGLMNCLGKRVVDRLKMGGCIVVLFNWNSFRGRA